MCDHLLIFFRFQRAGGVDQQTVTRDKPGRDREQGLLFVLAMDAEAVSRVWVTTFLAGCAGGAAAMVTAWIVNE